MRRFWRILGRAQAEIVLNADRHNYERFFRVGTDGELDWAHGIREFVVGTGGRVLFERPWVHRYSRTFNAQTHGVLRLRLGEDGYSWRFLSVDGTSRTTAARPAGSGGRRKGSVRKTLTSQLTAKAGVSVVGVYGSRAMRGFQP